MTDSKQEILKDFDDNWIKPWKENNFGVPNAHFTIKDFLSQAIDRVQIELLEEVKKDIQNGHTWIDIEGINLIKEIFEQDIDSKILSIKEDIKK